MKRDKEGYKGIFQRLRRRLAVPLAALMSLCAAAGAAEEHTARPVVLMELFTSQGCYSCPPADELMRAAYAGREDVLPLEFHVHYWDDLVYGFAGAWKDPFSSPEYTDRQRAYNLSIRGTGGMYTPQIVVHGRSETVGSRQARIDEFIAQAQRRAQEAQGQLPRFHFSGSAAEGWRARFSGTVQGNEDFYAAVYIKERTTEVKAGENKDKRMVNTHIVKSIKRHGGARRQISVPAYDPQTEGCAVWLQKPQTGAVVAAARCPAQS